MLHHRRSFLAASTAWTLLPYAAQSATAESAGNLHLAPFRFDVTPPMGHPCCGGWIKPVEVVDDPLEAIGVVLLGAGKPIVLCAVDWTGILNEAHVAWRTAIAEAAGTTPDRVAVHCVHQHNAPFACLEAEKLVAAQTDLQHIVFPDFHARCIDKARASVEKAIKNSMTISHVAMGSAPVEHVASNRRLDRDAEGRVKSMRGSASSDARLIAMPEGLIDPLLRTVAFFNGTQKVASLHYYATHPMSYYADGRVTSDFVGLARKARQAEDATCHHVYFTGCAGNVAAGKYNNGTPKARADLTARMLAGLRASEERLNPVPVKSITWNTAEMLPTARSKPAVQELLASIANKALKGAARNRPAYEVAWARRLEKKIPIVVSALNVDGIHMLHLPAESFVQYQIRATSMVVDGRVAVAAYGDGGPWYIPIKEEYPNGGYEVSVAFSDDSIDATMTAAMRRVLAT